MQREEFIARVRYLGWMCFQMGADLPLHDVADDYEISKERLESLTAGTEWALSHPTATEEDNHNEWMKAKELQGYTYGEKLDIDKKTHPSMVPFNELPPVEKRKDTMDLLMVKLANSLYDKLHEKDE